MRSRWIAFAVLLLAAIVAPAIARAQTPEPESHAEARRAMRQGIEASANKEYDKALSHYHRAMQLVPEANLPHRYAGQALEGLQRWEEAAAEYETYLKIKPDVSDAAAVRKRIEEIDAEHLTATVLLDCPANVDVTVDGAVVTHQPSETSSETRAVRMRAGPHKLRLRVRGYVDQPLDVDVRAGRSVTYQCALEREPAAPAANGSGPNPLDPGLDRKPKSSPWYTQWYTWAGAAAIVAGATIAIVLVSSGGSDPPSSEGGNHPFP